VSRTTSEGITPPSSLIQAHAPDQIPPTDFGSTSSGGSLQVVASPCWEMALPDVISAILTKVLGPLPRGVPPVHMLVSSRPTTASRKDSDVRHTNRPCNATSTGPTFRGCSQFVMFRLPRLLDPPVAPTAGHDASGRPGRLHHAELGWLPAPSSGIATCPLRATDTAGLPPAGLQPCRLLRVPGSREATLLTGKGPQS